MPRTARKIKALVEFAEEKIGDKSSVHVGDASFNLAEVGTDKLGSKGDKERTIEGYLFKSADSLDYVRLGDMNKKFLPFLRDPLILPNGELLMPDEGLRDQLVKEAEKLSALTSPRVRVTREANRMLMEIVTMRPGPDRDAKQREMLELRKQGGQAEVEQTESLDDAQVVEMVENAIRSNPQDFPLLTKYYIDAEQ